MSTALNDYVDFPNVRQVFRLHRHTRRLITGEVSEETVVGITSLTPGKGSAEYLLECVRSPWGIEAHHSVRDVTFQEDRSTVRIRSAPQSMALLRNLVISLIRFGERTREKARDIPVVLRELAHFPERVLTMLGV